MATRVIIERPLPTHVDTEQWRWQTAIAPHGRMTAAIYLMAIMKMLLQVLSAVQCGCLCCNTHTPFFRRPPHPPTHPSVHAPSWHTLSTLQPSVQVALAAW